jgi:hypothetical protein
MKSKDKTGDLTKALFSGNLTSGTTGGRPRPTSTRQDFGSNSIIVEDVADDFFNLDKRKNPKLRLSTRDP